MKRVLVAVLVSLFLVGCGKHYWNRPGASFADFSQDSQACAQENALYVSGNKAYGMVRPELYQACMKGRGWVRAQHPDHPPGWFCGIESVGVVRMGGRTPQRGRATASRRSLGADTP